MELTVMRIHPTIRALSIRDVTGEEVEQAYFAGLGA
jgi:hypothetical protein